MKLKLLGLWVGMSIGAWGEEYFDAHNYKLAFIATYWIGFTCVGAALALRKYNRAIR